jgi:hypothetical protein
MLTNLTKFWHKNELKKHSMAKRACGKYLETVLSYYLRDAAKRDYVSL